MSKVTKLPTPAKPEVPTLEQLVAQRTTLVLNRATAKDQIEAIERTLQNVAGMIAIHQSYVKDEEVTED